MLRTCAAVRGSGEGWASALLRACSACLHLHYLFRCFFAPTFFDEPRVPRFPKTKSAFEFASPRDLLSRRLTRSGNGVARARLLQMVRRARPAPRGRLRCRCRAHQRARACRILHVGDRWPHARAERQWQLVDNERPRKQRLGAADGPAGGLTASELAASAAGDV